jgi:integrase/recombinase XerD
MTQRRQRMIEDLQLRGLSARTQELYVRAIRPLAEPDHKSPDGITAEELRAYFRSLSKTSRTTRAVPVPSPCAASSLSLNTPGSGHGPP